MPDEGPGQSGQENLRRILQPARALFENQRVRMNNSKAIQSHKDIPLLGLAFRFSELFDTLADALDIDLDRNFCFPAKGRDSHTIMYVFQVRRELLQLCERSGNSSNRGRTICADVGEKFFLRGKPRSKTFISSQYCPKLRKLSDGGSVVSKNV